ncbi:MAG TPA: PBP1A family penicillin-binding protein [Candidatus Moranbacteria bacterium]|nr:PBP1A family penicillin-binding protein [Candidatus Moranbacteria bacterium]
MNKKTAKKKKKSAKKDDLTPEKEHSPAMSIFKKIATIIGDIFGILVVFGIIAGAYLYFSTPMDENLLRNQVAQTSIIYDRTGEHVLYEIHGEENRKVVSHSEIPDYIRSATIASEDNDFYKHSGIDISAIIRAVMADVESSGMQQGASTITQQLARNVFLSREKTFKRKISEIVLAIRIENNYTKDQILDMYLNEVPYGSNAYGVQSATETFFGKNASEITLDEAALLAALPNATTYYSPYGNHKNELFRKQQKILEKMKELGVISDEELEKAKAENTLEKIIPFKQEIEAPHFVFYVKEQLEKTYGKDIIEKGGFRIYTTLDWNKQKLAENVISSQLPDITKKYNATNASLVAIDPKTGEVLAMVGSKNYFDKTIDGQVNVATSPRQPGSSFKPFAYATAFEKGYQPETFIYDVPTNFGPDGTGEDYKPQNYNGNFNGLVTMRQALSNSLNIPAVKTLYLAGVKDTIDLAKRMGITTLEDESRFGLALVLGGAEVTLLDETASFGVFANEGKRNPVTGVSKIIDSQNNIFYENKAANNQVIHIQIARKINSILSDNGARSLVFGTGSKLYIPGKTVAAKTGTTQDFHDAWTVGYTPSVVTGVWVGNNDNTAMSAGADGSYVAAPIWNAFMSSVLGDYPSETFVDYDKIDAQKFSKVFPEVKYFNIKSGKEISEKKAKKTDPDKVEVRVNIPTYTSSEIPIVAEMQNTTDPMILRWRNSLKNLNFADINGANKKEED